MKIRRAHRPNVTKRAYGASLAGIAGLALTLNPASHASTQASQAGTAPPGNDDHGSLIRPGFREVLAAVTQHSDSALAAYTVRPGDSISGVAQAKCGTSKDWTGIYAASRKLHLTARNANVLTIGQELAISCDEVPSMLDRAPQHVEQARVLTSVNVSTHSQSPRSQASTTVEQARGNYGNVSASSYSGFEQCVIARESGGNSQVMNSTGHYGLFQFSASTWAAYGGSPADFGHASASEQEAVFNTAMAQGGESNWSPYDGC